MTEEFLISHNKTPQALGEKTFTVNTMLDGEIIGTTVYRARAVMTSEVWVYVSRGHTSDPGTGVSQAITTAHNPSTAFGDFVGQHPDRTGWHPKWEGASGTVATVQASRVNEAGFWEKVTTVETRTTSATYS